MGARGTRSPLGTCAKAHVDRDRGDARGFQRSRDESDRLVADGSSDHEQAGINLVGDQLLRPGGGGLVPQAPVGRGAGEGAVRVGQRHLTGVLQVAQDRQWEHRPRAPSHGTAMYRVHRGTSRQTAPAISLTFENGALATHESTPIAVTITNNGPAMVSRAGLTLTAPAGWAVSPAKATPLDVRPGASATASFQVAGVTAPPGPRTDTLTASVTSTTSEARGPLL